MASFGCDFCVVLGESLLLSGPLLPPAPLDFPSLRDFLSSLDSFGLLSAEKFDPPFLNNGIPKDKL